MTLRDRIANIISSTSRVDECADAILSLPEIAALREVAETLRRWCDEEEEDFDKVLAALARLEEAREGR